MPFWVLAGRCLRELFFVGVVGAWFGLDTDAVESRWDSVAAADVKNILPSVSTPPYLRRGELTGHGGRQRRLVLQFTMRAKTSTN